VLRFEDKIIFRLGKKQFDKRQTERVRSKAMFDNAVQIGPPAPEVIVGIDARHTGRSSPFLKRRDVGCNVPGGGKEFVAAWKIKVVDHIDQQ
jgi:hypothetical protein